MDFFFFQGGQRTGVCLLPCSGKRHSTPPASIILEINKFLIGMQWGKEQQLQHGQTTGQKVDDDTNRSISSIEEDFQTASEHLGEDSEDDGLRNGKIFSRVLEFDTFLQPGSVNIEKRV